MEISHLRVVKKALCSSQDLFRSVNHSAPPPRVCILRHGALLLSPPKWRVEDFGDKVRDVLEYNVHTCQIFDHVSVRFYFGKRITWRASCHQKDPVLATEWPGPKRLDDDVHLFGQPVPA